MKSIINPKNLVNFGRVEPTSRLSNRPSALVARLRRLGTVFLLVVAMLATAFLSLLGPPQPLQAAEPPLRYVAVAAEGGQDSSNDCRQNYRPCATIQRAIAVADSGDEIRVASGDYTGTVNLTKSVTLRGGFTTANWVTPNPVAHPTTLDAQEAGRVVHVSQPISATISGFRLTGGVVTDSSGGGVFNQFGVLTLENNDIFGNKVIADITPYDGGGVANGGSATTNLIHNRIYSNSAETGGNLASGGGLSIISGTVIVEGNEIFANSADNNAGGGVVIFNGHVTFRNNLIYNNIVTGFGGGIAIDMGIVNIENDTIYGNRAVGNSGGGIFVFQGALSVTNSLIISNAAVISGGGIVTGAASSLNLNYSDFFGNSPDNNINGTTSPTSIGTDNRITDPLFTNGLHLSFSSPAKDAASPAASVTEDFEGDGRPFGLAIDRGADEYTDLAGNCFARIQGGQVLTNVQAAVDQASAGGVVQVAGRCEGVRTVDSLTQTVYISKNLTLRGGYTVTDWLNPIHGPTILDANNLGRVVYVTSGTGSVNAAIENLHLTGGSANNGAGVYVNTNAATTLRNSVIYRNEAGNNGGGVYISNGGQATLQHNTIYSNTAANFGGGVYAHSNSASVGLSHNLVVNNQADTAGGGIASAAPDKFSLSYNDFYTNINGDYNGGSLSATDLTTPPGLTDPANENFRLNFAASQVIDVAPNILSDDFENQPRPQGLLADIGADESIYFAAIDLGESINSPLLVTDTNLIRNRYVTFTHTITNVSNTGSPADTFEITLTNSDGFVVNPTNFTQVLSRGVPFTFDVVVSVPGVLPANFYNQTIITAAYQSNPAVFDRVEDIIANPGVALSPSYLVNVNPGEIFTYTHSLTNTGPVSDVFRLTYQALPFNWTQLVIPQVVTVEAGQTAQVLVRVQVNPIALAGSQDVMTLTAASLRFDNVSATVTDTTVANPTSSDRHVNNQGGSNANNNCSDPDQPCATISHALAQAISGDTVKVVQSPAPYFDADLQIRNKLVSLRGGYNSNFSLPSGGIDPTQTVIDAQNNGRGLWIDGGYTLFRPTIAGFTLRNTNTAGAGGAILVQNSASPTLTNLIILDSATGNNGGGIYIDRGNPVLLDVVISNTTASGRGGAIYVNTGRPTLQNVAINRSQATRGGGLYNAGGAVLAQNLWISNSIAGQEGGGWYNAGGSATISQTRINSNTAANGGGLYNASGVLTLWNNFIYSNTAATGGGGGVYNRDRLNLVNNTLYANQSAAFGGGVYHDNGVTLNLTNTIIAANSAGTSGGLHAVGGSHTLAYNDFWGNTPANSNIVTGSGSISEDPLFVDPAGGDLHLLADSPAVDVADPATFLRLDFDGDVRPSDQGYDMGADELGGCLVRIVNSNHIFDPNAPYGSGPFGVLQVAIDRAPDDYIIQISGICRGVQTRQVNGESLSQTAILTDPARSLALEGGYSPDFAFDPQQYPTVIDPAGLGRAIVITGTDPIKIFDLTLTGGLAQGLSGAGGGLYLANSELELGGVVINGNQATSGGGLYSLNSTLLVTGSRLSQLPGQIISNTATSGGGLYLAGGSATVRSQLAFNQADQGGALYNNNNSLSLTETEFDRNTAALGGAVYNLNSEITGAVVTATNNLATTSGGGFYNSGGNIALQRSQVAGNSANSDGAGFYNAGGALSLARSVVISNTASNNGGGLHNTDILTMVNTIVALNRTVNNHGAGLYNQSAGLSLRHDTFYGNQAEDRGGAIYLAAGSGSAVINSTLVISNNAGLGGGVYSDVGAPAIFDYNDLWGNSAGGLGVADGNGNIARNPAFNSLDPASADFLRLQGGSPAEDAADPDSPVVDDIDGDPRPSNNNNDIGADEVAGCYVRNQRTAIVYGNIQLAANNASPTLNDLLQVAGTCQGVNRAIDPDSGVTITQTVLLTRSLRLEGGYNSDDWNMLPDPVGYPSALDALENGRAVYIAGSAVISVSGLHLRQGSAAAGGNIFVGSGVLTLTNSLVYSGTATNGGGIYNQAGALYLYGDNQLFGNTATNGGAFYNAGGQSILDDNDLRDNVDVTNGGAFYHAGGTSLLQNNIIRGNHASADGGGVYNNAVGLTVRHNTFYDNTAGGNGGGLRTFSFNPVVINNIFLDNWAATGGWAMHGGAGFDPSYNNASPGSQAQEYAGGVTPGPGSLTGPAWNPGLVNPAGGDFHLEDDSPVLDQGDPTMDPIFDFEGHLRPGDQGFDMGADERLGCLAKNQTTGVIYGNPQRAIDLSSAGDEIRVTLGECRGVHPYGPAVISQTIHIDHDLTMFGMYTLPDFIDPFRGYAEPNFNFQYNGGVALDSDDPRFDTIINPTTLSNPALTGRGLLITNSAVVTLEGFYLVNGDAVGQGGGPGNSDAGGGIYVAAGSQANLSFVDPFYNTAAYGGGVYNAGWLFMRAPYIVSNTATFNGGGIFNTGVLTLTTDGASADLTTAADFATSVVENVAANRGGGLYNQGGQVWLINNEPGPQDPEVFDQLSFNQADQEGGSLYNDNGQVTAVRFHFAANSAVEGGGIYNNIGGTLSLEENEIYNNETTSSNGGGLYNAGTATLDLGNRVYQNDTQQDGGGLFNSGNLALRNTFIYSNTALSDGGGLYDLDDNSSLIHNTFVGNNATGTGGAIYLESGSVQPIHNIIFDGNTAGGSGQAIRIDSGLADIDYNDYWPALPDAQLVSGAVTGTHSLKEDPLFVNQLTGSEPDDFHLQDLSPVINVGDTLVGLDHDFEEDPRPINGIPDMGADEQNACLAQAWGSGGPRADIRGSIGQALDDAIPGDTVRVAIGLCEEQITIDQELTLSGDWNKELTAQYPIGEHYIETEIMKPADGSNSAPVINIPTGAYTVTVFRIEVSNGNRTGGSGQGGGLYSAADKLTLDRMDFNTNQADNGGGMYISRGAVSIGAVSFYENDANSRGGGLYIAGGDVTVSGVDFYSNEAAGECGGGLYIGGGDVYLSGVSAGDKFFLLDWSNSAPRGGGMCFEGPANVELVNTGLLHNQATVGEGGGIYAANIGRLQLTNVGFYSNTATTDGGGLYRSSNGTAALYHATIRENQAGNSGGGVYNSGSSLLISATIVASNTAAAGSGVAGLANFQYNLYWPNSNDSSESYPSKILANPQFLPNYHFELDHTSSAINTVSAAISSLTFDHSLDPRPIMCARDRGVDEYDVERALTWLPMSPNFIQLAPNESFTYTFGLRNDSVHWIERDPPDFEEPGAGTGYTETITLTLQFNQSDWPHQIITVTGGSNLDLRPSGQLATLDLGPGEAISISMRVSVPIGELATIPADNSTKDFTRLQYQAVPWGCSTPINTATSDPAETWVRTNRSFEIGPNNFGTELIRPGETITYSHILTNTGNLTDTYLITPGASWYASGEIALPPPPGYQIVNLGPGFTATVVVSVTIANEAAGGLTDRTSVIAASVTDPTLFESAFNDTPIAYISGTRYVSRNGQDSLFDETDLLGVDLKDNNCTQPDTMPCRTVQQAASQAAPDDLIKIAQGVYTDVMSITHQSRLLTQTVFISRPVTLQGGFTEDNWEEDPPSHITNTTTLDPNGLGRVIYVAATGVVTIDRLILTNGDAAGLGGGDPIIEDTDAGGAIYNEGADLVLHATRIQNNTSPGWGGGFYSANGNLLLQNNLLHGNEADFGGAVYMGNGAAVVEHNTFYNNQALSNGGGLYIRRGHVLVTNTIFANNSASGEGGPAYVHPVSESGGATGDFDHNLYYANLPDNSVPTATVVIDTNRVLGDPDPLFIAPGDSPANLHLQRISPARDRGIDTGLAIDYDNEIRPQGPQVDIGADEIVLVRRLLFYSDTITTTLAGQPVIITHTLVNDGDITETVTLTVSSPLAGWGVAVTPTVGAPFSLNPQESRVVTAAYTVPLDANGQVNLTIITATAETSLATVRDEIHVSTTAWEISKVVTPTAFIRPGELLTYTLTLTNIGDLPSSGTYTVTDPLPENTSFVSAEPPEQSQDPVQWVRNESAPVGGAVTLTYVVQVNRPLTDGISIVNQDYLVNGGGAITTAAGAPVSVEVEAPATLTATKTASSDPVQAGGLLTYTITISNNANALGPALTVLVSDTLPAEAVFQSMGIVGPASGFFTPTGRLLQWQLTSPIQPGEQAVVTAAVRITSPLAAGSLLTNSYEITAANIEATLAHSITTVVSATNSITLSKSVVPTTTTIGAVVTYTVTLTNSGNGIANVALADLLPPDFTPGIVTTNVVAPGRSWSADGVATVSFTAATPLALGVYTNRAITATYDLSQTILSNTAPVTLTAPLAQLSLSKTPPEQVVQLNDPVTFTIRVTNTGEITLTTIRIDDIFDPTCSRNPAVTNLGPGQPFSYNCSIAAVTADFTNTVIATGTPQIGSSVATRTAEARVTLITPTIAIAKLPASQQVQFNGRAIFTISVTNTGNITLTNVTVVDPEVDGCDGGGWPALGLDENNFYTCWQDNVTASFTNTVVVTGWPPAGQPATDDAAAWVEVISPSLQIAKTPDLQGVAYSEPVTFTITVTNDGNVTLTDVTVVDSESPDCDRSLGDLATGVFTNFICSRPNVTANFINTAIVTGAPPAGNPVSASDTAEVDALTPAIDITKLPANQLVQYGDSVTFTITVTNTGQMTLTTVAISDTLNTACGRTLTAFNPNDHFSYDCPIANVTASLTNTVFVTGTPLLGSLPALDTAEAVATVISPSLQITKGPDDQVVTYGDTVTFTITVTNSGDVALTNVNVVDTAVVTCSRSLGDLAAGAPPISFECSRPNATSDFTNTVIVTGTPPVGNVVSESDTAHVEVIGPDIEVVKLPANQDIQSGDSVTFTISVTNTGDITFSTVAIVDAAAPDCNDTLSDLAPDQPHSYDCSLANVSADFTNTVIVTGTPEVGSIAVTGTAEAVVNVISPSVRIVKIPDAPYVLFGQTITYTIRLTNSGDVFLQPVTVTDALVPDCDNTFGILPVSGGFLEYTCSQSNLTADLTNTIIITAIPPVGQIVTDTALAVVEVISPAIEVAKTPDLQAIQSGDPVTFTITVTNSGDITLTNITTIDPLVSDCARSLGTLATQVYTSFTCFLPNTTADFTNIITVTGTPPVGPPVTDDDTATVDVVGPNIEVVKLPGSQDIQSGDTVTFTITVTNSGDITLTTVTITDAAAADCNDGVTDLGPNLPYSYDCSLANVTADFTNTVIVTGTPQTGRVVTGTAEAVVNVVEPDIAISKTPDTPYVLSGQTITYTIRLTNTGDVFLQPVTVTDVLVPDCDNTIGILPVSGGFLEYTCSQPNLTADLTNTIIITAVPPIGQSVTDTALAVVEVISPAIEVAKTPDLQAVQNGDPVTFTITVTNSGDITLTNITTIDPLVSDCARSLGALATQVYTSFTCVLPNATADFTNIITVTGTPPVGPPVTDDDTAAVDVVNSALIIAKTPDVQPGTNGQLVTFTIFITNNGDATLAPVTVTDLSAPDCDNVISSLAPGPGTSYDCSVVAGAADFTNTVVVTGTPPVGRLVSSSDTAFVDVTPPEQPRLISPPDQTFTNNQSVTFVWSPTADSVTYTLNLNGDTFDVTTTSHTTPTLAEGVYTWTVRSVDVYSRTAGYTDSWRLVVDLTPPSQPNLITPTTGVVISDTARPTFEWGDSTDNLSGPVTYTITITDSSGVVRLFSTTTTSLFTPTADLPTGVYTWTVTAHDRAGNASASPPANFSIERVFGDIYLPIIFKSYTPPPPPPPRPDLVITNFTLTQISGNSYRVRVTARNQSATPVTYGNNFHVNVYQTSNLSSAIISWGVQGSWFGAGQSVVLEQNYTFSSGPHTLRAWADPWNVVVETDETNNTRDQNLTAPVVTEGLEPQSRPADSVEPRPTPTNTP